MPFALNLAALASLSLIFICVMALSMLVIEIYLMPANGTKCPRCAEQEVEATVLNEKCCPICEQPCYTYGMRIFHKPSINIIRH